MAPSVALQFHPIIIKNNAFYDFNFFKFIKTCFVA